jgi:CheY-like chemotaxis protein
MSQDRQNAVVLIVDDDHDMRQTISDLLMYTGYQVLTESSARDALASLKQRSMMPTVIISDIVMPQMDGYQFYDAVRTIPGGRHIPFIFLSAKDIFHNEQRSRPAQYLAKPFSVVDLLKLVDSLAQQSVETQLKMHVSFEVEGRPVDPDQLSSLLQNNMLEAAMTRMAKAVQEHVAAERCQIHDQLPEVIVTLSSTQGLKTEIRGCCQPAVRSTTSLLSETLKQTAPFHAHLLLTLRVDDEVQPLAFDVYNIDEWVIGRSDADMNAKPQIDLQAYGGGAAGVSRQHARLVWQGGALHIMDTGSANGTYLNDLRLLPYQPYLLRDGDRLRLANLPMKLNFEYPAGSAS